MTIMKPDPEDVPRLDLGKKMSTPQDLMIEELSLRDNRGSQLFQQRQRRMQRFIFEHPRGYKQHQGPGTAGSHPTEMDGSANECMAGDDAEGQQSYHSELHVAASPQGGPPAVPKKTEKVLQMSKILNPDALAPGYSGPLKEVPPEKFNFTAIPKGYRSPWQGLLGDPGSSAHGENQLPMRPPMYPPWHFESFNRTPTPFDRTLVPELISLPTVDLDHLSALDIISHRPNFNRVAQGWVRFLPESEEL